MPKNLNITVSGLSNTGKSTICYLIKRCLEDNGFIINFNGGIDFDNDFEFEDAIGKDIEKRIKSLNNDIEIDLKEVQLVKNFLKDSVESEILNNW